MPASPTRTELLTLTAIATLGEDAYGVTIQRHIENRTAKRISLAGVYAALDRLHRLGLVSPWLSEPRPERGGRARRHYALTDPGRRCLREERALALKMWNGVPLGSIRGKR